MITQAGVTLYPRFLQGGGNNFGIVLSWSMITHVQGPIWVSRLGENFASGLTSKRHFVSPRY